MKKIKAILFDLDGTLLPMEQNEFMKAYFGRLARALAPHGYEPSALIDAVWSGTAAMVKNDGTVTNEEAYWKRFCEIFGDRATREKDYLEEFYKTDFEEVRTSCGFDPEAASLIAELRSRGYRLILATNPLFPRVATRARIRWAGLREEDFELITTYENSRFAKPNLNYYKAILDTSGLSPEECLMVGNDVDEDMVAEELGMRVFLVDKCIINKKGKDISAYPSGDFDALADFVDSIN